MNRFKMTLAVGKCFKMGHWKLSAVSIKKTTVYSIRLQREKGKKCFPKKACKNGVNFKQPLKSDRKTNLCEIFRGFFTKFVEITKSALVGLPALGAF